MGGIINSGGDAKAGAYGAKSLYVRGFPYANTAAKFWTSVLDEVLAAYPSGTVFELSAASGGLLAPVLLAPEQMLQRDMDQLESDERREMVSDALAVLELVGPSGNIALRLIPPGGEAQPQEIMLDYLDADLLPFLTAWLLEWAGVPDALWNQPKVRGAFSGDDPDRRYRYLVAFEVRSQLLSEELYHRTARLHFQRQALKTRAPAKSSADPSPS
jgi:hypothetical protein